MQAGTLVMMSRVPRAGETKTRLVPALGAGGACALARAFLEDLLERFQERPAVHRVVAWTGEGPAPAALGWESARQGPGDLGQRLVEQFRLQPDPVVFIGSDAPTLPLRSVERAFEVLAGGAGLVLQPALDGGFTLAGCAVDPEPFFTAVDWGTAGVLDQVLAHAAALPFETALLEPWYDVDCERDLRRLKLHLPWLRGADGHAPRTAAALALTTTIENA